MANAEIVKQIQDAAAAFLQYSLDNLISRVAWGEINFEPGRQSLESLFGMLGALGGLPLSVLPQQRAQEIYNSVRGALNVVKQIDGFRISAGGDPNDNRNHLCADLNNRVDEVYNALSPQIPYLTYLKGDVSQNIRIMSSAVEEAKTLLSKTSKEIDDKKLEIDSIVTSAREASASVGVAHFTVDFSNEADRLDKSSSRWLAATAILAISTLLLAAAFLLFGVIGGAWTEVFGRTVGKVFMLGTLVGATVWCGKIYKATKHQASMNRHRANALKTFQAFVKAAADESARDAVLMEATRSIFAITASGYLDGNDASGDGSTKIVEVIKGVSQAASAGKSA